MPRRPIIDRAEDIAFVRLNMESMTYREMAAHLNTTLADVFRMKTRIENANKEPEPKSCGFQRPPAKYMNRSHDEVLDYYLNLVV